MTTGIRGRVNTAQCRGNGPGELAVPAGHEDKPFPREPGCPPSPIHRLPGELPGYMRGPWELPLTSPGNVSHVLEREGEMWHRRGVQLDQRSLVQQSRGLLPPLPRRAPHAWAEPPTHLLGQHLPTVPAPLPLSWAHRHCPGMGQDVSCCGYNQPRDDPVAARSSFSLPAPPSPATLRHYGPHIPSAEPLPHGLPPRASPTSSEGKAKQHSAQLQGGFFKACASSSSAGQDTGAPHRKSPVPGQVGTIPPSAAPHTRAAAGLSGSSSLWSKRC